MNEINVVLLKFRHKINAKRQQDKRTEFKVMDMLFNLCRERYQQKDV